MTTCKIRMLHTWFKKEKLRHTEEEPVAMAAAKACLSLRKIEIGWLLIFYFSYQKTSPEDQDLPAALIVS